jgi:NAD(P)-dependent dehydrogenase (short-subunit alcohol dehydrogenase family)
MQASSVVAARHTIVTGGSSGIGLALVRRLGHLLLHADREPQYPREWEQWLRGIRTGSAS